MYAPVTGSVQLIDPLKVSDSGWVAFMLGVVYDPGALKLVLFKAGVKLAVSESVSVEVALPTPLTFIVAANGMSTYSGAGATDIAQVNDGITADVSVVWQVAVS